MSIVIQEPLKTVNGLITKALAAETQLFYEVDRQDYIIDSIAQSPSRINILGNFVAEFTNGDQVYIGAGDNEGIWNLNAAPLFSLGITTLQVDMPNTADAPGYLNNLTKRADYRLKIVVFDADTNLAMFDTSIFYVPNQAGKVDFDVGGIVTIYMRSVGLNPLSQEYYISVEENWAGQGTPPTATLTTTLQAILAKKQLLSVGGANMWENLMRLSGAGTDRQVTNIVQSGSFISLSLSNASDFVVNDLVTIISDDGVYNQTARILSVGVGLTIEITYVSNSPVGRLIAVNPRFLTKFKNPIMWRGWNRTVAVLGDNEYNNRTGEVHADVSYLDANINKVTSGSTRTDRYISVTTDPKVFISAIQPSPTSSEYLHVRVRNPGGSISLSETLYYRVHPECQQPIMLDWINSLGGVDQWLFTSKQQVVVTADTGVVAELPIDRDIEFVSRTKRRFAASFIQRMTLEAKNLTLDQLLALQEIKNTESLRVYLSKDGSKFIDAVVVSDFSSDYSTKDTQHKYLITIEFPDGWLFSDGKLY